MKIWFVVCFTILNDARLKDAWYFSGASRAAAWQNPVHCAYRSANHLIPTKLDRIAKEIGGVLHGAPSLVIYRAFTDSRDASPPPLFLALPGHPTDRHRFLSDAS